MERKTQESEFYIIGKWSCYGEGIYSGLRTKIQYHVQLLCRKELYNTVERWYYEPLYNEVCGVTTDIHCSSNSKIMIWKITVIQRILIMTNIFYQSLGPSLYGGSSEPALSLVSLVFIGLDRMSGGWRKIYREHCWCEVSSGLLVISPTPRSVA